MEKFKDFLNPKSMLTPGVAGGFTMMIANTLWFQFGFPQKWSALLISFMFGLIVFVVKDVPRWQQVTYYLLNSLIVFSMSVGTNSIGSVAATPGSNNISKPIVKYLEISPAHAQPNDKDKQTETEKKSHTLKQKTLPDKNKKEKPSELQKQQQAIIPELPKKHLKPERQFFQNWF